MQAAGIASMAMAVPERAVGSEEIADRLGLPRNWIESRTGVLSRRVAAADATLHGLAAAAGQEALANAEAAADEIGMVLVATSTADELMPAEAPKVAGALGITAAAAFDVGAACTGFVAALTIAGSWIESGRAGAALVIGADLMTRITDPADRSTAALFGDGAGAVVLRAGAGALGPAVFGSDAPAGARLVRAGHGDRVLHMEGPDTYRHAITRLTEATTAAAALAGHTLDEIDAFVYHQANARILDAVGARLGLDPARVVSCIERFGNTSAASIPIALCAARDEGLLEPGARVLLGAFGAGFTWGALVVELGDG